VLLLLCTYLLCTYLQLARNKQGIDKTNSNKQQKR